MGGEWWEVSAGSMTTAAPTTVSSGLKDAAAGPAYEFSCGDLEDRDIPADKDRARMVIVGRRP